MKISELKKRFSEFQMKNSELHLMNSECQFTCFVSKLKTTHSLSFYICKRTNQVYYLFIQDNNQNQKNPDLQWICIDNEKQNISQSLVLKFLNEIQTISYVFCWVRVRINATTTTGPHNVQYLVFPVFQPECLQICDYLLIRQEHRNRHLSHSNVSTT